MVYVKIMPMQIEVTKFCTIFSGMPGRKQPILPHELHAGSDHVPSNSNSGLRQSLQASSTLFHQKRLMRVML
jgi:hypothetical protein